MRIGHVGAVSPVTACFFFVTLLRPRPLRRISAPCSAQFSNRRIPTLLPAIFLLPILLGCRGEVDTGDSGLSLGVAISPTPPAVGPARLIITLEDSTGAPLEGAVIVVEGNMSHAGMAPVVDTAQAEDPGRYGVSAFGFTMAGDWILTVHASLPDGREVQIQKGTNVVGKIGGHL